jgi:hypothetical protein
VLLIAATIAGDRTVVDVLALLFAAAGSEVDEEIVAVLLMVDPAGVDDETVPLIVMVDEVLAASVGLVQWIVVVPLHDHPAAVTD